MIHGLGQLDAAEVAWTVLTAPSTGGTGGTSTVHSPHLEVAETSHLRLALLICLGVLNRYHRIAPLQAGRCSAPASKLELEQAQPLKTHHKVWVEDAELQALDLPDRSCAVREPVHIAAPRAVRELSSALGQAASHADLAQLRRAQLSAALLLAEADFESCLLVQETGSSSASS